MTARETDYDLTEVAHMVPVGFHTSNGSARYIGGYTAKETCDGWAVAIEANDTGVTEIHVAICADEHTARFIAALLNADQQRA